MAAPKPRVRLVAWELKPIVMADDGTNLTPVEVNAIRVSAADWPAWKDDHRDLEVLDQVHVAVFPEGA